VVNKHKKRKTLTTLLLSKDFQAKS